MHLRYRIALPLVAVGLVLALSSAMAARPAPRQIGVTLPPLTHLTAACQLGQTNPVSAAEWFFPSDDYYYTFFDPAQCGCPAGGITNLTAHWGLYWPNQCSIFVQAWIVKAVQTGPNCYVPAAGTDPPDPTAAETVCGPSAVTTITGSGLVDHAIALPACQCLGPGDKAFVLFKIVGNVDCPLDQGALASPAIVYDSTPDACVSYNGFLGNAPADLLSFGFSGNMTMWVEPDCCQPTPTLPGSWGTLKTLYR